MATSKRRKSKSAEAPKAEQDEGAGLGPSHSASEPLLATTSAEVAAKKPPEPVPAAPEVKEGSSDSKADEENLLVKELESGLDAVAIKRRHDALAHRKRVQANEPTDAMTQPERTAHLEALEREAELEELVDQLQLATKAARNKLHKAQKDADGKRAAVIAKIRGAGQNIVDGLEAEKHAAEAKEKAAKQAMHFESDKPALIKGGVLGIVGGIGYGLWTLPPVDPAAAAEAGKGILEFLGAHSSQILHVLSAAGVGVLIGLALAGLYVWGRHSNLSLSDVGSIASHEIPPPPRAVGA